QIEWRREHSWNMDPSAERFLTREVAAYEGLIDHCEMSSSIQIRVREQSSLKKRDSQRFGVCAAHLVDDTRSGILLAATCDVHRKAPIAKRVHAGIQSGGCDT